MKIEEKTPYFHSGIKILENHDKPTLEIRFQVSDRKKIEELLRSAYYEQPVILYPKFRNKAEALGKLEKKGILERTEDGQYVFLE